jgi:pro-apoptotic serine protease NMA111
VSITGDYYVVSDDWHDTLDKIIPSIVTIECMTVRYFDTYSAGSSSATGFIVDYDSGLILTNRYILFLNHLKYQ